MTLHNSKTVFFIKVFKETTRKIQRNKNTLIKQQSYKYILGINQRLIIYSQRFYLAHKRLIKFTLHTKLMATELPAKDETQQKFIKNLN